MATSSHSGAQSREPPSRLPVIPTPGPLQFALVRSVLMPNSQRSCLTAPRLAKHSHSPPAVARSLLSHPPPHYAPMPRALNPARARGPTAHNHNTTNAASYGLPAAAPHGTRLAGGGRIPRPSPLAALPQPPLGHVPHRGLSLATSLLPPQKKTALQLQLQLQPHGGLE
jgi:hypothetical protein